MSGGSDSFYWLEEIPQCLKVVHYDRVICLPNDHDLERGLRHLEIHAAIVIHLDRGVKIELDEGNFLRGLRAEHPKRSSRDRVIPHFFNMLVPENQRCLGLRVRLRPIARFHICLQPVDFPAQRLNVALQSAVLFIGCWIRSAGIYILIILPVVGERIVVPPVIAVRIISRIRIIPVRVIRIIAPSSIETAMISTIVKAVSRPEMNAGDMTKISAVESAGGVSGKSAVRGEMSATAATRC